MPFAARTAAKVPTRSAFASALRRLARRDHSEAEIREALAGLGHDREEIDETIARLKSARYLDDKGYAERYTRSRVGSHLHGRIRVRHDLKQRGVAGELVERALTTVVADGTEREALDNAARKYWRFHASVPPETRLRRMWGFLLRRGFPAGMVGERLRSLWPKQGETLDGLDALENETE